MKDKYYLYLDTADEKSCIALYQGKTLVGEKTWPQKPGLEENLTRNIKSLISESNISFGDLSGICIFEGPGSFTGLRIGFSFANGLAFSLDIPIYVTNKKGILSLEGKVNWAVPVYGKDPSITVPKRII